MPADPGVHPVPAAHGVSNACPFRLFLVLQGAGWEGGGGHHVRLCSHCPDTPAAGNPPTCKQSSQRESDDKKSCISFVTDSSSFLEASTSCSLVCKAPTSSASRLHCVLLSISSPAAVAGPLCHLGSGVQADYWGCLWSAQRRAAAHRATMLCRLASQFARARMKAVCPSFEPPAVAAQWTLANACDALFLAAAHVAHYRLWARLALVLAAAPAR